MFALTTILSMAEADPPELRNTGIEMTAPQFAAAHWLAEVLARRTIDPATPPSEAGETCALGDPIPAQKWRPHNGAPKPGIDRGVTCSSAACCPSPLGRGISADPSPQLRCHSRESGKSKYSPPTQVS